MQSKDPQAVALAKKRWANKTPQEKHDHAMKMVKAKKLKVQHLPSDYPKDYGLDLSDVAEMISEQEARWGEPLSTNE